MTLRRSTIVSTLILGFLAVACAANAAIIFPNPRNPNVVPITIDVEVSSGGAFVSQGTATAGGDILDVLVNPGDTLRFIVGIGSGLEENLTSYATNVNADDPNEIDYITGSGVELSGINFAPLADPDYQLDDDTPELANNGIPGIGPINSAADSVKGSNGIKAKGKSFTHYGLIFSLLKSMEVYKSP